MPAAPALVREDGAIMLGLQVHSRSNDVSRDIGHALEEALAAEPGTMLNASGLPGPRPTTDRHPLTAASPSRAPG